MADYPEDEDTGEPIRLYSMGIINERKDSGRVILASVDVRIGGICIKQCLLTLNPEGEPRLARRVRRDLSRVGNRT